MKALTHALTILLAFSTAGYAELVSNGDFQEDFPYWEIVVREGYGAPPDVQVANGELVVKGLHGTDLVYLFLMQAVDIQEGVRYRLRYEIKGPATGNYRVRIGETSTVHVGHKYQHYIEEPKPVPDEWTPFEPEFVGKYTTDGSWLRKIRRATRKHKIVNGRTPDFGRPHVDEEDQPEGSTLFISIGDLTGEISLRKVSIVALDGPDAKK